MKSFKEYKNKITFRGQLALEGKSGVWDPAANTYDGDIELRRLSAPPLGYVEFHDGFKLKIRDGDRVFNRVAQALSNFIIVEGADDVVEEVNRATGVYEAQRRDALFDAAFDEWYATFDGKDDMEYTEAVELFCATVYDGPPLIQF